MSRISPEQFVHIWQTSNSHAEIAEKTGMSKTAINARSWRYRSLGIPLKRMKGKLNSINIEKLKQLARVELME